MSRIKRLTQSYSKYIAVPWRDDAAAAQRVIFCVPGKRKNCGCEPRWMNSRLPPARQNMSGHYST